jgi:hypothetical protein
MLRASLTGTCMMALLVGCATHPAARTASTAGAQGTAGCVSETGSRIQHSPGSCTTFGRTYSGDDLQRTGEPNVGDALERLDPSLTVHH